MLRDRKPFIRVAERGVSLIELLIGVAVLGFLLAAGMPAMSNWLQNTQIRTAAESIKNGLQIARTEAVRLNRNVRFQLTDSTESGWKVNPLDDPDRDPPLALRTHGDGSINVSVRVAPSGSDEVTFNSFGQVLQERPIAPITRIDVTNSLISSSDDRRDLRIVIPTGGFAKLCDPKVLSSSDPRACP